MFVIVELLCNIFRFTLYVQLDWESLLQTILNNAGVHTLDYQVTPDTVVINRNPQYFEKLFRLFNNWDRDMLFVGYVYQIRNK